MKGITCIIKISSKFTEGFETIRPFSRPPNELKRMNILHDDIPIIHYIYKVHDCRNKPKSEQLYKIHY
jgi:hypothetical protein